MSEDKGEVRQFGLNPHALNLGEQLNPDKSLGAIVINAADKLKEKINHDPLTGAYNRYAWEEFKKKFDSDSDSQKKLALIAIDLNALKKINDEESHSLGDDYLKRTVSYFSNLFPEEKGNKVYRTGGDEIIVACSSVNLEDIGKFNSYVDSNFDHEVLDRSDINLDFSYGVAFYDQTKDAAIQDCFDRADKILSKNKAEWKAANPDRYPSH